MIDSLIRFVPHSLKAQRSGQPRSPTHFRWVVLALIFFISTVSFLDRSSMSYAMTTLSHTFNLTPSQMGFILGGFAVGYAMTPFLAGMAVDRFGSRITLSIAVIAWSISIGAMGALASGFVALYMLRICLGIFEGAHLPTCTKTIRDWLAPRERVKALSMMLIAMPLAMALGAPLLTALIIHTTWRGMFIILGCLGLLWLPFWWLFFRNTPQQSPYVNAAELHHIVDPAETAAPSAMSWKQCMTHPTLITNYFAFFVSSYFHFFFMTWLPTFLSQQYHLNLKQVGLFAIAPWLVSAVLLSVVGKYSDAIFKRTGCLRYARTYLIMASQALAALSMIPLLYTHNITWAIVFISLALGCSMSANAALYAVNLDVAGPRAGTAAGLMVTCSGISGFLAPVLTGYAVEKTATYTTAFLLMITLAALSIVLLSWFHHPDRKFRCENTL